jgi:nucleolar complex protein 2
MKRWLKDAGSDRKGNRNHKVNSAIKLVLQKVESNVRFVEEKRAKVDFAPGSRAGVERFLKEVEWESMPLGAFVVGQRMFRERKNKVFEEGRRADEKKRRTETDDGDGERVEGGGGYVDMEQDQSASEEDDDGEE